MKTRYRRSHRRRSLGHESLEPRELLAAVITVNSTADSNTRDSVLTMREALRVSNRTLAISSLSAAEQALVNGTPTSSDRDTIRFNIPANDPNHFYYQTNGAAGVGLANVATTTAANDASIGDIDADWAYSWYSIRPTSPLPLVTDVVLIDGFTQSGASANTNPVGQGLNTVLKVEISGENAGEVQFGLIGMETGGDGSTIRGLALNRTTGPKLGFLRPNMVVEGNFIGPDVSGTLAFAPPVVDPVPGYLRFEGISATNLAGHTIGGAAASSRNLISGNSFLNLSTAISLRGTGDPVTVQGNLIGTDRTGTAALGNEGAGILIDAAGHSIVDNVISANHAGGISATSGNAARTTIQRNKIGTDVTGAVDLGNVGAGVAFGFGDGNRVIENTIAFNASGVSVGKDSTGNLISHNAIFSNYSMGIDLASVTSGSGTVDRNDLPPDSDPPDQNTGGNHGQNYPLLGSVTAVGASTRIAGSLASTPNRSFRIEFFANGERDEAVAPGPYGEGQTYLGSTDVTTNAAGNVSFSVDLAVDLLSLPGDGGQPFVTSTATDITDAGSGPANDTSELSPIVALGGPSFVVTKTGETGLGTLREAIINANLTPGAQTISFAIPASDPRHFYYRDDGVAGEVTFENTTTTTATNDSQIADIDPDWPHSWFNVLPTRALPAIIDTVNIDGYSQPGARRNTLAFPSRALDTVLRIELDGRNVPGDGLNLTYGGQVGVNFTDATQSTIQGLAINAFGGDAIELNTLDGQNTIAGNFIGSDIAGALNFGNGGRGVYLFADNRDQIGGSNPENRNLISGNIAAAIEIFSGLPGLIEGNIFNGDRTGSAFFQTDAATIFAHNDEGLASQESVHRRDQIVSARVKREFEPLLLQTHKLSELIDVRVHQTTITKLQIYYLLRIQASSAQPVVEHASKLFYAIVDEFRDYLYSKGQYVPGGALRTFSTAPVLGFDLGGDGVSANDAGDADEGANGLQNFPVLTSARTVGNTTTVEGSLNSLANSTFRIEIYASSYDTSELRAGERSLGTIDVTTNASGNASFSFVSPEAVPAGQHVIALATRFIDHDSNALTPLVPFTTSEFSEGIVVTAEPLIEFAAGVLTVTGTPGDDILRFSPRGTDTQVRYNGVGRGQFPAARIVAFGGNGNDRLSVDRVDGMPPAEFHGGEGNDRLYGAYAADLLYGDAGRDTLEGFNGHDRLFGGDGDDLLDGGRGNDVLYGEGGNDRLRGYVGNDLLFGGAGRDYLNGDDGNNVLVGGDANDRLGADGGRNILIGGLGRDFSEGGNGGSILISGATTHDASEAALLALLAEWASTRTLDQRVARLTSGVGPNNQYALTFNGTVQNDNAWSTLEGGAGEDWFFKYRKDTLVNADPLIDEITQ